jgi:flagellar assembly protein FliH
MWSKAQRLPAQVSGKSSRWRPGTAAARPHTAHGQTGVVALVQEEAEVPAGPTLEEQLAEAYERGCAEGRAAADAAMTDERARLEATIADIAHLRRHVMDAADHDVMQLAVSMARRVLHREVQLDPDVLLAMARVAIGRLGDRVTARVHLSPVDLNSMVSTADLPDTITLIGDPDVLRGGCRIVSDVGQIDLGIDAQMTELSRSLIDDRAPDEPTRARLH